MKTLLKLLLATFIAIGLIILIKPFVKSYQEKKQYAFSVQSIDGTVTKEDFEGKVLALYFGYTYCPDACPTSLSALASALDALPQEKTKDFQGVFISVDPQRDTLENLQQYAKYFHPNFIGATSNKENLDDIVGRYGSFYKKIILEDSAMEYSVSHTSYIYVFDKKGRFVEKIEHFSNPQMIRELLEKIL